MLPNIRQMICSLQTSGKREYIALHIDPYLGWLHVTQNYTMKSTRRTHISDKADHYLHIPRIYHFESQPSCDTPSPPNVYRVTDSCHISSTLKAQTPTPDPSVKFHCNPLKIYWVMLIADKQTNATESILSLLEIMMVHIRLRVWA